MKYAAIALAGIVYVALVGVSYSRALGGWAEGHSDVGFWWAVVGSFLLIAGLAATYGALRTFKLAERSRQ